MPLIDCVVLCALDEELTTLNSVLRSRARASREKKCAGRTMHLFRLPCLGGESAVAGEYTVAIGSDFKMGGEAMAQFAIEIFRELKPQAAVLTGIAASAIPKDLFPGDVAVSSQVFSYANVAVDADNKLSFRKSGYQVSAPLRRAAFEFKGDRSEYAGWRARCAAEIATLVEETNVVRRSTNYVTIPKFEPPQLVVELGAAGPFLVRSADFRDELRGAKGAVDPRVAWVEMEAHGFMEAAHERDVRAIVVKGISDSGDGMKTALEAATNGFWRLYSSANAAHAIVDILRRRPLVPLETNHVVLDMSFSSVRYGRDLSVFIHRKGATNLAFPRLLEMMGPSVGVQIRLSARASDGSPVLPAEHRFEHRRPGAVSGAMSEGEIDGGDLTFRLPDSEVSSLVGLAMAFGAEVAAIEVRVTGDFDLSAKGKWEKEASS
jgi:nucleoside phosphorylase